MADTEVIGKIKSLYKDVPEVEQIFFHNGVTYGKALGYNEAIDDILNMLVDKGVTKE